MKNILLTLASTMLICGLGFSQSILQVNIKDCREENGYKYLNEFNVFRNDSLIATCRSPHESKQKLKKLEFGSYRIEYFSIFHTKESISFELTEMKEYSIDLCVNHMTYDPYFAKPIIDKLKSQESYSIDITSLGCFHSAKDRIIIKRIKDEYRLTLGEKEKLLGDEEIEIIRRFEEELYHMESFGCTTVDTYVLKFNGSEIKISDGSCDWNGAFYLKRDLNLIDY